MTVTKYNPEDWLETLTRGIQTYAEEGFNNSVLDPLNNPVGSEVYEVMMQFPPTNEILTKVPLVKTIVHFEIDIIDDIELGFSGRMETVVRENYDPVLQQIVPQEGLEHRVNFDVGIWSSDRSGGTTARLRAYQNLIRLFQGKLAFDDLKSATTRLDGGNFDGALEIYNFTGGRFLSESINDVTLYRVIDCNLVIRCYSRTSPLHAPIPTIEEIDQDAELIIDDELTLP